MEEVAQEIENEIRVIEKIRMQNGHENVVQITNHGWLIKSEAYFIDMELCEFTLRDFLNKNVKVKSGEVYWQRKPTLDGHSCFNIFTILIHIATGLVFLHQIAECHRDVKPENSASFVSHI